MMHQDQYDEGDPPRDPVVQQWFASLGAPPDAQEPPGARLRMLAQIDQRRKPAWLPWWLPSIATPAWATGLAIILLLSLSLNVWWGRHVYGPDRRDARRVVATRIEATDAPMPLSIYRFQTRLQHGAALGTHVAERLPDTATAPVVGFTPQARRTAFVRMGRLYADALAALQHATLDTARQHLTGLTQALTSVQAPPQLTTYLDAIQRHMQEPPDQIDPWRLFLAGFEPLYQDAYATRGASSEWLLFTLGAWLENLYLAAATGDVQSVQQGRLLPDVQQALPSLHLPPTSLASLTQLHNLIEQPGLSVTDLAKVQHHIQTIQDILGE